MPNGEPAIDEYVVVEAKGNHRELFLAWRGDSLWSGEYDEMEWVTQVSRHYGKFPYAMIVVTEFPIRPAPR